MPICEICDREVDNVSECSQCNTQFCEFCGDNEKRLCDSCRERDSLDNEDFEEI